MTSVYAGLAAFAYLAAIVLTLRMFKHSPKDGE